jgi:hypothetical protein
MRAAPLGCAIAERAVEWAREAGFSNVHAPELRATSNPPSPPPAYSFQASSQ